MTYRLVNIFSIILLILIYSSQSIAQKYKDQSVDKEYELYSIHEVVTIPEDNTWMNKKAKNIILLIGDGMSVGQITAGMVANKGELNLSHFPICGFSKTASANDLITDSAAGGTAMATGEKTNNGMVGVNPDNIPLTSILKIAEKHNLATGLVATSKITDATPASFIAHASARYLLEKIASDFLKTDIDYFVGGGRNNFTQRLDQKNLLTELETNGYTVAESFEEFEKTNADKVAALLYPDDPPSILQGRGEMLSVSTMKVLEALSKDEDGFFLMIEGSQIDWGSHSNNGIYVAEEMLDFDRAIGIALEFASENQETLVVVTADHETGGMSVISGDIKTGAFEGSFNIKDHSANIVPVFAFGPGAYRFGGFYENTEIFNKMMETFAFPDSVKVQETKNKKISGY